MKRPLGRISSRSKKIACTVSAAALMLGVSSAATVGLHFMENYSCRNAAYSGYPVTLNAFGIAPSGWENLMEMENGYGGCPFTAPGYTLEEVVDSTTSTNGLNPLPNGSLDVTWFGNSANFAPFYGNAGSPPSYTGGGPLRNPTIGAQQIYATFIRDGINFGPPGQADNPLKDYYYVDITGVKSLFTNTPFVVELIASSDSMFDLTNAFVIDEDHSITNSVTYPATPPVGNAGGAPWTRGNGGGLSTASGVFSNVDHIHIMSNIPQHGGTGSPPTGFDDAGTISGFIMTDKPVVTMPPNSKALANLGDTIALSAYAIGVPPLSYQWQLNGQNISGATATNYTVTNLTMPGIGFYSLVVTNLYGSATSQVANVGAGHIVTQAATASTNVVYDSNPDNPQHDGVNTGATWVASNTVGSVTRTGVMSFGTNTNTIVVADNAAFDGTTGTISFWMESSGTDTTNGGTYGAAIICRPVGNAGNEFAIVQPDSIYSTGLQVFAPGGSQSFTSTKAVSDSKWHFVTLTFDETETGGVAWYIDGALDSTNSNAGNWTAAGSPLDIGAGTDNYYRPYDGLLDDVRYYSVVLSPSQISAIYSAGNSVTLADPADLQLQFNFTAPPGAGLNLSWPADPSAVLQSAPTVIGPWTPVGATSPYTIIPAASQQFFRYIYSNTNGPQTFITNPYLM